MSRTAWDQPSEHASCQRCARLKQARRKRMWRAWHEHDVIACKRLAPKQGTLARFTCAASLARPGVSRSLRGRLCSLRLALRDDRRSFALADADAAGNAHGNESSNECEQKLFHWNPLCWWPLLW